MPFNYEILDQLFEKSFTNISDAMSYFVENYGDASYCAATPSGDCFPEVPEYANFANYFNTQNGSPTNLYKTASCELWSFPNGAGGRYYLNLNCIFLP